jgi:hypothetical protein
MSASDYSRTAFVGFLRSIVLTGSLIGAGALVLHADTIVLRSGAEVRGTFLGGTARQIRVDQNGEIRTYDIEQVQSVIFSDPGSQAPPPAASAYPPPPNSPPNSYPPPPSNGYPAPAPAPAYQAGGPSNNPAGAYPPAGLTIPVDTRVTVRMIDSVNSDTAALGQTFRASLDEPIFVNGQQVVPRGADVLTKLVANQQSGKIEGRTALTMALATITINGRPVDVTSTDVRSESSSRGARSGKVIGGAAALGAIIGGIAGGGKGAAIGAGSGAAVGTGAEVMTAGQKVNIPSETRLTFRLQAPVQL